MKKFYKTAETGTAPGGHVVRLDGKVIKTPLQHPLLLPTQALAAAVAQEWAAQGDEIQPLNMPLTRLANTMVDKAHGADRAAMNAEVLKYGGSDLVCYFAAHPPALVRLHEEHWKPLLAWLKEEHGIAFEAISGIQHHPQPSAALDKLKQIIEGLGAADFTIVQSATASTGSIAIALALLEGKISAEQAYEAACVDEVYQLKTWGADELAQKKLDALKADLQDIARFRDFIKASS